MKNQITFLFVLLLSLPFTGCDNIPLDQIEEVKPAVKTGPNRRTRNVLLEYFTGHTCGNCPTMGGKVLDNLAKQYPEQLIQLSIHSGFFAKARPKGQPFDYNFQTDPGTAIDNQYGVSVSGTPKGLVNRKAYQGSTILTPGNWSSAIASFLQDSALVGIKLNQTGFNSIANELEFSAAFSAFENLNFGLITRCYLIEDSVINWQRDYTTTPQDAPTYVHRKALRAEIISSGGTDLTTSPQTTADDFKVLNYKFQIPEAINPRNSSVIVIVQRSDSKEVLQAAKMPVTVL